MTPPVVLISPAMGVGSRYYRPLVDEFTTRGWVAHALPRRGFELDRPRASRSRDWSYADEIQDTADAVASARAEYPGRQVILLGHSLGAQIAVGHQLSDGGADGVVAVAASVPYFRHYSFAALGVLAVGLIIRISAAVAGFVPRPVFGAPGARTLMLQWTQMVFTGQPPFPVPGPMTTPVLAVRLENDTLSVPAASDHFERLFVDGAALTQWTYELSQVPEGGSTHHVGWVRTPGPVVDRITSWWESV